MWGYQPDENPKRRHHWKNDFAGHIEVQGKPVGKCPANMTMAEAQELLDGGYEFYAPGRPTDAYPGRIYAVKDGVVYRATPSVPGVSYHGFPELRENFPPSREAREAILELARKDGTEEMVSKWLK